MKKTIYKPNSENIQKAVQILEKNGLIGFPTETVYGLGASAISDTAVTKIYSIKKRPFHNPLIIHVSSLEQAKNYGIFNNNSEKLAEKYWPGPLTLLLNMPIESQISAIATSNLQSVALRVPSHPVALNILKEYKKPIAAPSANLSGTVSATMASHVFNDFGDDIEMIIDGDQCTHGIESTIVDVRSDNVQILREGAITKDQIFKIIKSNLDIYAGSRILAPGQLEKHYSPKAKVRINAKKPNADEYFITLGREHEETHTNTINLSKAGDLHEFAYKLYACLRDLDSKNVKKVAISPIPDQGIGTAINDRIKRASKR
tara:strand:- start:111 stop:1061 length:951 start_codon:yes stop_codon:yes gene_type:complete